MPRRIGAVVGAIAGAAAVTLLLAGCIGQPPRADANPHLPLGIPESIVATCEQNAGLGGSAPVVSVWRDIDGIHARIGVGSQFAVGSGDSGTGTGTTAAEQSLVHCLTIVSAGQPVYPVDDAGRLQQWRYSATVLWACFSAHDADPGPVPSRSDFLGGDPLKIDPYYLLRSPISDLQSLQLQRDCPLIPAYLRTEKG